MAPISFTGRVTTIPTLRYTDSGPELTFSVLRPDSDRHSESWTLTFHSPEAERLATQVQPQVGVQFRLLRSTASRHHRITHLTILHHDSSNEAP